MITAEQRITRRKFMGASDVAAVLGLDPYRTPADVYLSKTADLVEMDSDAAAMGNHFERPILQWAEKQIGELEYDIPTCYRAGTVLCANLDARHKGTGAPVEAKLTGITQDWGDSGTDQVPEKVLVQVTVQMMCNPADEAIVSAMLTGCRSIMDAARLYRIPFNVELSRIIEDEVGDWWDKHVVAGIMPDSVPSIEVAKRIRPKPGAVAPVDPAFAAAMAKSAAVLKAATEEHEGNKARVLAALAGAEVGECPGWSITNKTIERKSYTVEAGSYQRLTVKAAK